MNEKPTNILLHIINANRIFFVNQDMLCRILIQKKFWYKKFDFQIPRSIFLFSPAKHYMVCNPSDFSIWNFQVVDAVGGAAQERPQQLQI